MEIPQSNKGSAWEEADEAQAKSDLARYSNEVLWAIFQRAAQFEPLNPEIVWDDPMLLHRGEVERIGLFIKDIKASLRKLGRVSDALESSGAKYRADYLDHLHTEFYGHDAYIAARPFSECLRCWTAGYSINRQKYVADDGIEKSMSWQNYLEEAAKSRQKVKAKKSEDDNKLEFHTLRREFLKLYEENRNHRGLFRDTDGNLLLKPSSGPRPNGPVHEEKEVIYWVCDSKDAFGHSVEIHAYIPGEEDDHGASEDDPEDVVESDEEKETTDLAFSLSAAVIDVVNFGRYRRTATIYDRYFCPKSESCGGVLVPRFRDEFATETVD